MRTECDVTNSPSKRDPDRMTDPVAPATGDYATSGDYTTGDDVGRQDRPVSDYPVGAGIGIPPSESAATWPPASGSESSSTADVAKDEAGNVKDTAVDAGKNVAATAKDEAGNVVQETKQQAQEPAQHRWLRSTRSGSRSAAADRRRRAIAVQ